MVFVMLFHAYDPILLAFLSSTESIRTINVFLFYCNQRPGRADGTRHTALDVLDTSSLTAGIGAQEHGRWVQRQSSRPSSGPPAPSH